MFNIISLSIHYNNLPYVSREKTTQSLKYGSIHGSDAGWWDSCWNSCKSHRTAFICIVLFVVMRSATILSAQVVGGKMNIAKMNTLRYVIQVTVVLCICLVRQVPLVVDRKLTCYILLAGCLNTFGVIALFFSATIMPLGNMDAVFFVFLILLSSLLDFMKGIIKHFEIIRASLAIIGILMVSQPWLIKNEIVSQNEIPCDYWDESRIHNSTGHNWMENQDSINSTLFIDPRFGNGTFSGSPDEHHRRYSSRYTVYINGIEKHIIISSSSLGYLLLLVAAVFTTLGSYTINYISDHVDSLVLILPLGIVEGLLSAIISIIWCLVDGVGILTIPGGFFCLTFIFVYAISAVFSNISFIVLVSQLEVSNVMNSLVVIVVLLYIYQRTFMGMFQPGRGNWEEVFGILFVMVSYTLPFLQSIFPKT